MLLPFIWNGPRLPSTGVAKLYGAVTSTRTRSPGRQVVPFVASVVASRQVKIGFCIPGTSFFCVLVTLVVALLVPSGVPGWTLAARATSRAACDDAVVRVHAAPEVDDAHDEAEEDDHRERELDERLATTVARDAVHGLTSFEIVLEPAEFETVSVTVFVLALP